jgi:hypothetical protein
MTIRATPAHQAEFKAVHAPAPGSYRGCSSAAATSGTTAEAICAGIRRLWPLLARVVVCGRVRWRHEMTQLCSCRPRAGPCTAACNGGSLRGLLCTQEATRSMPTSTKLSCMRQHMHIKHLQAAGQHPRADRPASHHHQHLKLTRAALAARQQCPLRARATALHVRSCSRRQHCNMPGDGSACLCLHAGMAEMPSGGASWRGELPATHPPPPSCRLPKQGHWLLIPGRPAHTSARAAVTAPPPAARRVAAAALTSRAPLRVSPSGWSAQQLALQTGRLCSRPAAGCHQGP